MRALLFIGLLAYSTTTYTATVDIDTSRWSPALTSNHPTSQPISPWTGLDGNNAAQDLNGHSALISDYTHNSDFIFSGVVTPTDIAWNDNDIIGIVFGWQDSENHYRLGWEQDGLNDISSASGLFLVREVAGNSTILYQSEQFWQDNVDYNFNTYRSGDTIGFSLDNIVQSFVDSTFTSGKVGLYVESQSAQFAHLSSVATVPIPAAIFLFTPLILLFLLYQHYASRREMSDRLSV